MRDDDARARLDYARHVLEAFVARRRAAAVPTPIELVALLDHLSATERHRAPNVADGSGDQLLLRLDDAARRLSVSPRSLTRLIADGRLPTVDVGGGRIAAEDLAEFVKGLPRRRGERAARATEDCEEHAAGGADVPDPSQAGERPVRTRRPQQHEREDAA